MQLPKHPSRVGFTFFEFEFGLTWLYSTNSDPIYVFFWNRAIAEYLSRDLPYKLLPDDVYVTAGCTQAIEIALSILSRPGANILLPRPGFPIYGLCAAFRHLEVRYFDLLPDKQWEVDLSSVEDLADHNTVAMVIINPGNPCGNVYSYQHLKKVWYFVLASVFIEWFMV